jgi:peptidoglycan/LPS O-acetylase OafA/YrhL
VLTFRYKKAAGYTLTAFTIVIMGVMAAVMALRGINWHTEEFTYQYGRALNFFLGVGFYFFNKDREFSRETGEKLTKAGLIFFFGWQAFQYSLYIIPPLRFLNAEFFKGANYSTFAVAVGIFALGCQHNQKGKPNKSMQNPVLMFFNKISYALYLYHMFLILLIKDTFPSFGEGNPIPRPIWFTICYIPIIGLCMLLGKYVETPCNNLAKRLTTDKPKQAVVITAEQPEIK